MKELITIKTISQLHDMLGIEKPNHPLISIRYNEKEKPTPDLSDKRISLELYNISFKGGITGKFGYGRNSYDFHEGTMVFTSPGQVISPDVKQYKEDVDAWTLNFHPDLVLKSELGKHTNNYSFFSYDANEALHLSEKEKKALANIICTIEEEINLNIDKHSHKLIVSNIELLLDYCNRYYDRQFYTRANMNKDYISKFVRLIKAYYDSGLSLESGLPSVKYFADELNLSANYLSDLLRKETGKNTIEQIHLFIIEKAKLQLLNSSESVSQIAYGLGFEYPQHFSKIFKKKTGISPAEYRNLN